MSYEFGDVLLVRYPRAGGYGTKQRPALVILDIGDVDTVIAPITSVEHHGPGDCAIQDWLASGLLRTSWVRLAKLTTVEKTSVIKRLGHFSAVDSPIGSKAFRDLYSI